MFVVSDINIQIISSEVSSIWSSYQRKDFVGMNTDKKAANAVGGKTARACDSCMCKRARWYCTADDAFLCLACDASVHSANSLARRHERVRLKTASLKPTSNTNGRNHNNLVEANSSLPTWHQGFHRKARTPRHGKPAMSHKQQHQQAPKAEEPIEHLLMMNNNINNLPLVPELGSDEASPDENEEQLLYRVPIFDPFVEEFCSSVMSNEVVATPTHNTNEVGRNIGTINSSKIQLPEYEHVASGDYESLSGLNLPSDMGLTEFAADVETLLGRGLDEDSYGMEGLGLLESKEEEYCCFGSNNGRVKEEEDDEVLETAVACHMDSEFDISKETLDLNFDYESPTITVEEEEDMMKVVHTPIATMMMNDVHNKVVETPKTVSLRLSYEAVISAWATQGSPWTTGGRPPSNSDDYWPEYLTTRRNTEVHHHGYGDPGVGGGSHAGTGGGDGGREARVSRYREKRRTRLFSKKIRYEVRKLNAEKRPRLKGRFVKRTSNSVGTDRFDDDERLAASYS